MAAVPAVALQPDKQFNHYERDEWSLEQGLPQLSVAALAQDADGYLWIGTMGGLARFDGVRMTSFSESAPAHLPGTMIKALRVGPDGSLWIGTYRGLARYRDGGFSTLRPQDPQAPLLNIESIAIDAQGTVLVAAQQGVYAVVGEQLRLRHRLADGAYALLPRADGLWVGSRGAVLRYPADGGPGQSLPLPEDARQAPVRQLLDAQGRLWAGSRDGLLFRDGERWQRLADAADASRRPVEALFQDHDGNLWVGLPEELLRLRQGRIAERYAESDRGLGVNAIFEDRERNLWLGSRWRGVIRLWDGWTRRYSRYEGLHDALAWSLARDPDGSLWVGTASGVARLRDGRFEQVLRREQLPQEDAYTLLAERGQLWIGTRRGALLYRDGKAITPPLLAPLRELQVNGIVRDRAQRLWFATSDGVFRADGARLHRYGTADGLRDARVRVLRETRDGRLLVGSQSGLYELRGERMHALSAPGSPLADADITALHELPGGQLLAGTLSEQLWVFDGQRWTMFDDADGLPANTAFFITDDGRGTVWVAGMRGVYRMPLKNLLARIRAPATELQAELLLNERGQRHGGVQGLCCNGAGNGKGFIENGTLWLPSRDGVVAMDTASIVKNAVPPQPRVERVRVQGRWRLPQTLLGQPLPVDARDLDFEFTAASFQAPENVELKYRLLGYDTDWRMPEDIRQRSASYTNLPGGDYVFEVTGSNNAGVWADSPARLPFRIRPRFHETLYSRLLLALGLAALVLLGVRVARIVNRRQREGLERLVHERTEALQAANQRLQEASFTDELTQLRNRRYLSLHIPSDIALYRRMAANDQDTLAAGMVFALIDVDHFKAINDSGGHHTGDAVLQQMARLLVSLTRESDYVVRWGGEEFLLVLRSAPRENLGVAAERLCRAIAAHPFEFDHGRVGQVTCSIGLAEFPFVHDPDHKLGWEQLLILADRALYQAKANGRNGWAAYRPVLGAQVEQVLAALQEPADRMQHHACLTLMHR